MRLVARDQEMFWYLISLLNEAGLNGVPAGGNELVIPDGSVIADPELRDEIVRVTLPGTAQFVPLPGEGNGIGPVSAPGAMGVMGVPAQAQPNRPASPMPVANAPEGLGPTPMHRPPRAGPGSNIQEQRRYAVYLGLDVPPDAGRDEIVSAIDEHEASTTGGPQ